MLRYKVANLITAAQTGEVNVIGHVANCFCSMNSGIAPQIAKAFPGAFEADLRTTRGSEAKLGSYSSYYEPKLDLEIFNLYAQYGNRERDRGQRDLNYTALSQALSQMNWHLKIGANMYEWIKGEPRDVRIGLPKLGSALSGGDWNYVSALIENHLEFDVTIYVLDEAEIPLGY